MANAMAFVCEILICIIFFLVVGSMVHDGLGFRVEFTLQLVFKASTERCRVAMGPPQINPRYSNPKSRDSQKKTPNSWKPPLRHLWRLSKVQKNQVGLQLSYPGSCDVKDLRTFMITGTIDASKWEVQLLNQFGVFPKLFGQLLRPPSFKRCFSSIDALRCQEIRISPQSVKVSDRTLSVEPHLTSCCGRDARCFRPSSISGHSPANWCGENISSIEFGNRLLSTSPFTLRMRVQRIA